MSNVVEILVKAKDLSGPALARSQAEMARLQATAARQSAAAAAASDRTRAKQLEGDRLAAAERASVARRSAGQITAAQRAAEREQIAGARAANRQQIAAARTAEREQVAAARRASAQVAAAQRESAASAQATAGVMKKAMAGAAIAVGVIGFESIKMASKFDSSMTLLQTQAGVAESKMGGLKKGVLALAGKVGQDPDSLAESLFHVESNFESMGISSKKALALTETAAKGATTGHADLVDVTNALTAAVASNIPGVENLDQAMGVLNATVGVGDMKMQDLASAFSSGMVATVKGFGLSITDVGAALAVFGDNNIRGSLAGNQLRMSVMALAKPVSTAHDALKKLGLTQTTLAKDMQKGGLKLALEDLTDRMKKAGIGSKEQGQIITDAFGRKAGAGLNVLLSQMDRVRSKYPALKEGADKFGKSWSDTQKTAAFQSKALKASLDAMMISLGEKLIPAALKVVMFLKGPFAHAVGPMASAAFKMMGQEGGVALTVLGKGLKLAAPLLKDLGAGFQAVGEYVAPFVKELGHAGEAIMDTLLPSKKLDGWKGPFTKIRDVMRENKGAVQEAARQFGTAVISMAEVTLTATPIIIKGFQIMATSVLDVIGTMVDGAATAFGDLPIIGDKFKNAATKFDRFKASVTNGLGDAAKASSNFAKDALPKLQRGELKLNISNWKDQIATAKKQMKSVPPEKKAALKARIDDLQAKVNAASKKLGEIDRKKAEAKVDANTSPFFHKLGSVKAARIPTKSGRIIANPDGFWAGVHNLVGRTLGTSYVDVRYRKVESSASPTFKAAGGPIRLAGGGPPDGGQIVGPGSGTSDSIPAMLSNGEYVVRASSVQKYGQHFLDAVNEGRLPKFAKGGKLTKAQKAAKAQAASEKEARHDASGDLTVSHFGHMAGYKNSEFHNALGKADGLGSLVSALNQWRGIIKKATHGAAENKLLKQLDATGKKLIGYEKAHEKVTKSLEKAKDKLNSLKDAASQLSASVKDGLISSANITKGATGGEGPVTLASVQAGMTVSRDKVTAFASALKQLQAKGFSKSIIQQVAEAGIDGGGLETAGALLQASSSQVSSINSVQGQISKAAGDAGKTTADAVYSKAIEDQTKAVEKLTKQQEKLAKSMEKLAKAMEKLIEKAFKKKATGGIVGAAATGGVRGGLTLVGEQEPELLDLPIGSRVISGPDTRRKLAAAQPWASMLSAPRRPAASAGQSLQPIIIHQTITLDGRVVARQMLDPFREEIRSRGGNVQKIIGQPGR